METLKHPAPSPYESMVHLAEKGQVRRASVEDPQALRTCAGRPNVTEGWLDTHASNQRIFDAQTAI